MASRLLNTFKQKIDALELIPSGGGCFELSVEDELVYSKLQTGRFPDEAKLTDTVSKLLVSARR